MTAHHAVTTETPRRPNGAGGQRRRTRKRSGLSEEIDHADRVGARLVIQLLDVERNLGLTVISTMYASIDGVSFRRYTRSLRQRSRAKGEQSYGSFGRFWIILGSVGDSIKPDNCNVRFTLNSASSAVRRCSALIGQRLQLIIAQWPAFETGGREATMDSSSRRRVLGAAAGAAALSVVGHRPGFAQQFPARGILVIVPYAAGGGSDVSARLLARDLEPILGKSVTVENRAGGGGWIGWGSLAASKPDGYTIGYINAPSMFAGYLDKSQGGGRKENLESFTPLINHVVDPNLWAVRPDSKFKTVKDVIDEAKRRPGTITLNGGGHGTDDHVAALGIGANNETSFQMVHFRGTPEGKTQVLAGNIEVLACNVSEVAEDITAGQFRILGVMSAERSPFIPNGPTFREQGFNEVWAVSRGIAAPAGLPKDVETALIGYLEKTISSKEHKSKAEALALDPQIIKGEDYRKFLKDNEQATKKLMNW